MTTVATAAPVERETYSVREVAALLGIGKSAIYERIARGEFPVRPITWGGRRVVLPRAEIDQLVAGTHPSQQSQ